MSTITSITSGSWSVGTTWSSGSPPADNDIVIVDTGHTVVYDADMSGSVVWPNGIDGLTITGTLKLSRNPGTYYLKIKAAKTISGAGTFDCGASALDPIPFAAKHTITGGSGWYIQGSGGLTMTVYAAEPAIKTIRLSADEAAGQTVLSVDTDVTGDIWADGDTIRIIDIDKGLDAETRVIAAGGRSTTELTVTASITKDKIIGAYIVLVTRNVNFTSVTGASIKNFTAGKLTIAGGCFSGNGGALLNCAGATISDGVITQSTTDGAINNCVNLTVSGGVFVTSCSYALLTCNMATITGGFFGGSYYLFLGTRSVISGGVFCGAFNGFLSAHGLSMSGGTIIGCGGGICSSAGISISGGTFTKNLSAILGCNGTVIGGSYSSNTQDIYTSKLVLNSVALGVGSTYNATLSEVTAYNTLFPASTENYQYTLLARETYSESINHNQVAGAYRAWTKGGVTSSQATILPTGYTTGMATVLENATAEGYWQKEISVGAGASVNITSWLRKTASMSYLPRVIIFNKASTDPFAGGAGLHTFTMTDSIDTYESDLYTYTNGTAADVTLVIRVQGMNATGTVYSVIDVEQLNVDLTTTISLLNTLSASVVLIPTNTASASSVASITGTSASTIWTYSDRTITAGGASASTIADAVWDEAMALHQTPGTSGSLLASGSVTQDVGTTSIEGTITLAQALQTLLAFVGGKSTGGGTTQVTFRNIGDTKNRIVMTVDGQGNRSSTTLNLD